LPCCTSVTFDCWKKKIENLRIFNNTLHREIEKAVNSQKQKINLKNLLKTPGGKYDGSNITNLYEEKKSLDHSLKISDNIRETGTQILNQLEEQENYLGRIRNKVYTMYNKLEISNSITQFLIRRGKSDMVLFVVLVIITLLIIYYTYYHLRPKLYGSSQ